MVAYSCVGVARTGATSSECAAPDPVCSAHRRLSFRSRMELGTRSFSYRHHTAVRHRVGFYGMISGPLSVKAARKSFIACSDCGVRALQVSERVQATSANFGRIPELFWNTSVW
jgi:hypothetical protein